MRMVLLRAAVIQAQRLEHQRLWLVACKNGAANNKQSPNRARLTMVSK